MGKKIRELMLASEMMLLMGNEDKFWGMGSKMFCS